MPFINLELEEEKKAEDMTPNLRVGFKERQCKRLSEALSATPLLAKKSHPEAPREEPTLDFPMGRCLLLNLSNPA